MKKTILLFVSLFIACLVKSQNVGIGNTQPLAKLHVTGALLVDGNLEPTPDSGPGTRMMWIPAKAAFRAGVVDGFQWNDVNIGSTSFAAGNNVTASGVYSTAMGNLTYATGNTSTAIGSNTFATGYSSIATGLSTIASGYNSTAMGGITIASGNASTAIGYATKSKSFGGFVAGVYNDTANAADPINSNNINRIFQLGNGTADNARSNAMTILQNGNVGIGTTTPAALVNVKNGSVLFEGSNGVTPISGAGTRMMWIPAKSALRAGYVNATQWDDSNIGSFSFAAGINSVASGSSSTAMGSTTIAAGNNSTALGTFSNAKGDYSTSMGYQATANGYVSTALGYVTAANGSSSVATGLFTVAKSFAGFVVGSYNDSSNAASGTSFDPLNRVFQVGNGTAGARSNAMTVLANGNVGIGALNPVVPLQFAPSTGDKIALWSNGTNHYGFGIQPSLFQVFSESSGTDIAFGYGNSAAFTENMRIKGNGDESLKGNITVQNGKGIIHGADGTQQKELTTSASINTTLSAGASTTVNFTFPESFSSVPDVYVGNILSGAGGWAEVIMTVSNITNTGGTLYINNPRTGNWSPNFTVRIIAIGPQ